MYERPVSADSAINGKHQRKSKRSVLERVQKKRRQQKRRDERYKKRRKEKRESY